MLLFAGTVSHAAYPKLAKHAGVSYAKMDDIVKSLVKIETTTGKYTTRNKSSGAYGRYQVMPKTAKYYSKKLHIPVAQWKKPRNQDKIFKAIMTDNIKSLKRNGHRVSAFSIYGSHQQGAGGFNAIMKSKSLSKRLEKNLRQNLPSNLKRTARAKLKSTWISYWKKRLA
ncbi:MAG: lytic transglycosylase [Sulfurovum sp.]|nr:lytic transglycosylase [Sulfurovum sp.]